MKIALFNVKFSPNLGDGLLSECLERELQAADPRIEAFSIDLAGRTSFGSGNQMRGALLRVLESLPDPVRRVLGWAALSALVRLRLRPHYREALAGSDAVVVGGGNLFADSDLNFPMKISGGLAEARARGVPVAVFGVGVTGGWSAKGAALFGHGLKRVRLVDATVRDERSQDVWNALLPRFGVAAASLCRDPGLLAAHHYPRGTPSVAGRRVGLCITDPLLLRYHGGKDRVGEDIGHWYGDVVARLADAGYDVVLFTNGSPEDRAYLAAKGAQWTAGQANVSVAPGFRDPAGLAAFLSGCDLVIAHRMHACIAAHSFAVPTIGLAWDVKLDSFFAIAGRSAYMLDPARSAAAAVVALAGQALAEGVDPQAHAALLAAGRADVARLARLLVEAVPQRA